MTSTERTPSISAVGEALVALEDEIGRLQNEQARLSLQYGYVREKLEICRATIADLLRLANGGHYPVPCPKASFPALNHPDD